MSGLRPPESHVAQQIRRDKLRVQNTSQEFPNNLEQLSLHVPGFNNLDLLQVRNVRNANNMLDEVPPAYSTSPSEVVANFPTALNPPLDYQEQLGRLMMHHHQQQQYGSFHNSNSLKEQSEVRNLGNWRSGGGNSNQGYDNWFVNYGSGSVANTEGNNHNTTLLPAAEISNVSYNELTGVVATSREPMHPPPPLSSSSSPLYQNALQDIIKSASISAQGSDTMASLMQQTGQGIWVGDASELELHPSYGNQLPNQSRCGGGNLWTNRTVDTAAVRWSSPHGFADKKVDEQSGTLLSDSNPQSLSLSLSSNAQSKTSVSHFEEGSASDDLQSKDPQYMKYVRSFMKPSVVSRDCGKSPQDSTVGVGVPPSTASYRNVGPLGPFTGYATILKSSRFLKSAQQLLDEFCCLSSPKFSKACDVPERVSGGGIASTSADALTAVNEAEAAAKGGSNSGSSSSMFYGANENNSGTDWGAGSGSCLSPRPDFQQKKARLLYMLEEVTRRYKQYHQQMQMVVSSFDSVAGLSSATPYISLALKSVSRHFRSLKNSISDQLKHISEVLGEDYSSLPTSTSTCSNVDANMGRPRCMNQSFQKNKPGRGSTGLVEPQQHVWRPQRGLPERAVAILKAWLFEHFLHPYPTDTDKHMLATQTGLSRNQVSNWFINARVRVWKPMVEEIHTLETKGTTTGANQNNSDQNEKACGIEDGGTSQQQHNRADKPVSKFGMMHSIPENQSHHHDQCMEMDSPEGNGLDAEQWSQEKRSRLECQMSSSGLDGSLMGFVPYRRSGLEVGGGGLGSVSLTLGLRHGVEGAQSQQQQLQEEQLRRHLIWRAYDP